ncbi:MAG: hypothetical protein JNL88_10580 [Bacteroidia bacterium]|nr:hypothetical protein [Bacteroidia bacterium]
MPKILLSFCLLFTIARIPAQTPASWQAIGPIQFPVNSSGQINGIGRVCQMKFHPSDPQKVYAVSASGGLWISNNATLSWNASGTDQLPLGACASVCIDFTNDSILYLSTGDPNYYSPAHGIYKSTDGGANWFPSNTGVGVRMALEILMDPADHLCLVAATNDGIWKTLDGGLTWTVRKSGGQFTDMTFKPAAGSRVLYAVTYSGEFYRSDDFGDSWQQVFNGISVPGGGSAQGMRLAVSAADTNLVYAGMIKDEGSIFKSSDGGFSFTLVYHNPAQSLVGYDANGNGQGNYNFTLCADPNNPNIVFTGAHVVWRSVDGGVTWTQLTQWWQGLHTDMHHMLYNPYNTLELYNINDGGVWRSMNAGLNWSARSNGLEATEVYKAASNPLRKDMNSIGTQDNGELYSYNGQWRTNRGGDWGSRMTYDYQNLNLVYYHENGKRRNVVSGPEVSFGLPFTPDNSCRIAFSPMNPELGLAGMTDVFFSNDLSSPVPFWSQASFYNSAIRSMTFAPHSSDVAYVLFAPNIFRRANGLNSGLPVWTTSTLPVVLNPGGSVSGIASDSSIVYVTAGSKVYRSADQGISWSNVSYNLPTINILKIISDPHAVDESVYICNAAGVWYKNQTMTSWYNFSQGLPSIANITDFMFYDDGPLNSVLRVATYGRGVWESPLQSQSVSLEEQAEGLPQLLLIPNPARDQLRIMIPEEFQNQTLYLEVFQANGQLVLRENYQPQSGGFHIIRIQALAGGHYQLRLTDVRQRTLSKGHFIKLE